jgi:LysR family transcriptional regulator, glycine cleavage system transcriptional activator
MIRILSFGISVQYGHMTLATIDGLQCFLFASRTLNFRAAARAASLSPAAFSDRIHQLEAQLGVALFFRTTRAVRLTDAGVALVARAEHAISAVAACSGPLQRDPRNAAIDIVLGTRYELGMNWLLPALTELRKDQPWVTFHLYFGSASDLFLRVRLLEVDCAITSSRFDDSRLEAFALHEETYSLVGTPSLLRRVPLTKADDARNHTLVDISDARPLFRYFIDAKNAPRLGFKHLVQMGTIAAIRDVVRHSEGVAVLPEYYTENDIAKNRLCKIFPRMKPLSDAFRLVFRANDPRRTLFLRIAERLRTLPLR